MISSHIVKEDRIILYFDYSFEVGSFDVKEKKSILKQIYDYLKNTKTDFDGKKIMLMLGSTLVATLIYTGGMMKLDNIEQAEVYPIKTVENVDIVANNDIIEESVEEEKETKVEIKDEVKVENTKNNIELQSVKKPETVKQETLKQPISTEKKQESVNVEKAEKEEKENLVTIYRSNGTVLQIEMEEYIVGVVAAEMPASFNTEALKAQAVIARTYALKKISRGEALTDTVSTQSYIDVSQMKIKWGSDYSKYYNKIVNAVNSTKGEYLTYNGQYIEAVYHSTSNGYTEDSANVWGKSYPYLKSVESSWDKSASSYLKITNKEFDTVMKTLGIEYDENADITIISRNESGRVSEVKIGDNTYSGVELRNLLGLRSADFDIEVKDGNMIIITRGYGHGVGLSQYGANGMAKAGYSYKQIINHYYSDVKINK